MSATRVLLIDDHEMVREGLAALLDDLPDLEVVGQAGTLREADELCRELRPDVAACDYQLPDGVGAELGRLVVDLPTRVLVISGIGHREPLDVALSCGCAGFVAKHAGMDTLAESIRLVANNAAVFPAEAIARLPDLDRATDFGLTEREFEVLELLSAAASTRDIAAELTISLHTARNHVRTVMAKLGATTRLQAVVTAVQHGLVELGD